MAASIAARRASIDPGEGLRALEGLLGASRPAAQVIVTAASWSSYLDDSSYAPALLAEAAGQPARAPSALQTPALSAGSASAGAVPASASTPEDRRALVRQQVAKVSGLSLDQIPCDQPLVELGLDSLMLVELRNGLSRAFGGRRLPMGLVFGTVDAIAQHAGGV